MAQILHFRNNEVTALHVYESDRGILKQRLLNGIAGIDFFLRVGESLPLDRNRLFDWSEWRTVPEFLTKLEEFQQFEKELESRFQTECAAAPCTNDIVQNAIAKVSIRDEETLAHVVQHTQLLCQLTVKSFWCAVPAPTAVECDWEWLRRGHWCCGFDDKIF
jgi:uncharacterized damage-inducible protein DinB